PICVEARRQPGRSNLKARLLDTLGVVALDQRVIVGQEVERIGIGGTAGDHGGANGTGVVAQMWRPGGGDASKDSGIHRLISIQSARAVWRPANHGKRGGRRRCRMNSVACGWPPDPVSRAQEWTPHWLGHSAGAVSLGATSSLSSTSLP